MIPPFAVFSTLAPGWSSWSEMHHSHKIYQWYLSPEQGIVMQGTTYIDKDTTMKFEKQAELSLKNGS